MARSEMTEHSFRLFLSKNDINNSVNSSWAWLVCCLVKFQLCMVCGSNFSGIKVQSASETVYEAFNFCLKLLGVLSKHLA